MFLSLSSSLFYSAKCQKKTCRLLIKIIYVYLFLVNVFSNPKWNIELKILKTFFLHSAQNQILKILHIHVRISMLDNTLIRGSSNN